jgi:hypothetical protein
MDEAGHRLQRRALADAIASEKAHHLPSADCERDTVQNVAFAVIGVDFLDGEEGLVGNCAHVFK